MNRIMDNNSIKREVWVDWMRVIACFMVMVVHSTEPFYLGGEGSLVLTKMDALWVAFFDSLARACVPLFVIASSYLQFPIHYPTREFLKRRAVRVLIPFLIWTVFYALYWGKPVENLKGLLLNFNYAAGHLWFVYMLLGLYLLMPLLSPWAEKVGRKELLFYIGIWGFTTFIPYIREFASGGEILLVKAADGLPAPALFPLWGEASWNPFGLLYYFSGFIGYMLLGLYLRKFAGEWSRAKSLGIGIPSLLVGLAISAVGFYRRILASAGGAFPVGGDVSLAVGWETAVTFNTIGVALMSLGWILLFRQIRSEGVFYRKVLLPVSQASYGMYLCHMVVLALVSGWICQWLGTGGDTVWTTPVEILLTAACTFIPVALLSVLLRRIPRVGKWLMG